MAPDPTSAVVPAPRAGRHPYRVAVVCLGNICRSPMAHVVLEERLTERGLDRDVEVLSAGTGGWHLGDPMDRRAAATLTAAGYDPSRHVVEKIEPSWLDACDLVLVMDAANLADTAALARDEAEAGRVRMFRAFDPQARPGDGPDDLEVPDPYYGGDDGFALVLAMVERTAEALADALADALSDGPAAEEAG